MSVRKLIIHAILQRTIELEQERIEKIRNQIMKPFLPEPIEFKMQSRHENFSNLYDKNGKLFDIPKSKFHK